MARLIVAAATLLATVLVTTGAQAEHPVTGWALQMIKPEALKARLDVQPPPVVVDVRSPDDFRGGHIPTARSLSLDEPGDRFRALPRRSTIVLYCSCPMSEIGPAYQFMRFSGFQDVLVLDGGYPAWVQRGFPVAR